MPQIEIRPYANDDEAILSKLEHYYMTSNVWQMERLLEEGKTSLIFNEIKLPREVRVEIPKKFTQICNSDRHEKNILVATLEHIPVGYICLEQYPDSTTAWITNLVVNQSLRRQGIGTALLLAGHTWALQRKWRRVIIDMQTKNYPAIQLVLRAGYEFN